MIAMAPAAHAAGMQMGLMRLCDGCHQQVSPTCEGYTCQTCKTEFDLCSDCLVKSSLVHCPSKYGCNK